jgi:predicted flap endonuclease-1-like 5' DNA nuclease
VPAVAEPKPVVEPSASVEVQPVAIPIPPQQAEAPPQEATTGAKLEFMQIRGISQNRAEQLKSLGINTMDNLANASALDLAEKLGVSPKIVKMWIGSAKKLSAK